MAAERDSLGSYVIALLDEGRRKDEVEVLLKEKGHDESFIKELMYESVKLRDAKRRSQALTLVLAGAFVCLISFVLTITSSFTHSSFGFVLYGLTSIGIIIVFAGFTKVF